MCRMDTSQTKRTYPKLVGRIAELGLVQADLAVQLGIHPTLLNAFLRGRRPMPEGMEERIQAALDRLERAKAAAAAEYRRVLAEES